METILQTSVAGYEPMRGKVRDVYDLGDKLLIVATDRISAFDVVMANGIPYKGIVLTQISKFWFDFLSGQVEHHLLSDNVRGFPKPFSSRADQFQGRSMLVKKVRVLPIECVVRGYLAGSGWKEYQQTRTVCGVKLPPSPSATNGWIDSSTCSWRRGRVRQTGSRRTFGPLDSSPRPPTRDSIALTKASRTIVRSLALGSRDATLL